jgi:hypothetical protein
VGRSCALPCLDAPPPLSPASLTVDCTVTAHCTGMLTATAPVNATTTPPAPPPLSRHGGHCHRHRTQCPHHVATAYHAQLPPSQPTMLTSTISPLNDNNSTCSQCHHHHRRHHHSPPTTTATIATTTTTVATATTTATTTTTTMTRTARHERLPTLTIPKRRRPPQSPIHPWPSHTD